MKHLLKLGDLSEKEILEILNLADQLKYEQKHGIPHEHLKGKTLGMIFQKSSTRTRVSFETGMYQLGGQALFLSNRDLQIGRGEPVQDTARVLSRYLDGIMIRTFEQKEVEDLATYGSIPVINGLTDYCHPCQILADLMTIREYKGSFQGLKACFIGDGNNMANSLIVGCLKVGMSFALACPKGYEPNEDIVNTALEYAKENNTEITISNDINVALDNVDVVYTDVWVSMGDEAEAAQREIDLKPYQVNKELMNLANDDAIFMHCLPAIRGQEVTAEVIDGPQSVIYDEAENRLHAQKAVLYYYLKD